jgi:hypothetical protein
MNMKKITLKISAIVLFAMSALQVQAQNCPELFIDPGVYKLATCNLAGGDLYMTINGATGQLEWAAEITGAAEATQLWTIQDHREPAGSGFVEITADLSSLGAGSWTMIVDQASYDGPGDSDNQVTITARSGDPVSDTADSNYGFDQFQRRKATGWTGAGNNALFAKPPGQGNFRYTTSPVAAAGDPVVFLSGGTINDIRFIFVEPLSTEEFDASSVFISNPVKDELSIEGLNQSIKQIAIYDLLGKQVLISDIDDSESVKLDVSSFTSGLYIVKIEGENGASITKKIIKE